MSEERDPPVTLQDPMVMRVGMARYGDDASVVCIRRGRDARIIEWERMRGESIMSLVALVVNLKHEDKPMPLSSTATASAVPSSIGCASSSSLLKNFTAGETNDGKESE
jgi:hypothetical protein